jgi:hypothetical protein
LGGSFSSTGLPSDLSAVDGESGFPEDPQLDIIKMMARTIIEERMLLSGRLCVMRLGLEGRNYRFKNFMDP